MSASEESFAPGSGRQSAEAEQLRKLLEKQMEETRRAQVAAAELRRDSAQASIRIAKLERELTSRRNILHVIFGQTSGPPWWASSRNGDIRLALRRAAVIVLFVLFGLATVLTSRARAFWSEALQVWTWEDNAATQTTRKPVPPGETQKSLTDALGGESPLTNALVRLEQALSSMPGAPAENLRAARLRRSTPAKIVCDFQWDHGQPALVYNSGGGEFSLSRIVDDCAEALEQRAKEQEARH